MKKTDWTDDQKKLLKKIWLGKYNLKESLHLFPGRTYTALVQMATRRLQLGSRPFPNKGNESFCFVWALIEKELKRGPGTSVEIAKRIGVHKASVRKHLKPDGSSSEKFHVSGWVRRMPSGGSVVPVYSLGPGENAPKIGPMTNEEEAKRRRDQRLKQRLAAGVRPRFVNPFAAAAGLISAPPAAKGRVVIHLHDY